MDSRHQLGATRPPAFLVDDDTANVVATIAKLPDWQIARMTETEIIDVLDQLRPPFLERRVHRRLSNFDLATLRRILFLCRRGCSNQAWARQDGQPIEHSA